VKKTFIAAILSAVLCVACASSCRHAHPSRSPIAKFPGFPAGAKRTLALDGAAPLLRGLSWRERRDQMRDWLLYTVVFASGQSPQQISRIMSDVPPVRADYLETAASFPAGPTRTAYLGAGEAVVLVPFEQEEARLEDLARAADQHRKNLGKPLAWVHVFEYEFTPRGDALTIRRLYPVDAATLYTAAAGYQERLVRSVQDLQTLLSGIDDLTFARLDTAGLHLGGRKLRAGTGLGLSMIAEAFQSDAKFRIAQQEMAGLITGFNAEWSEIHYRTPDEKARLLAQRGAAQKELEAKVQQVRTSVGPRPANCGFSLDPYPEEAPQYQYQKATYICALQGTQTGMVLFYTDLLAKLWAIDFEKAFPRNIAEFVPMTETSVSAIHRSESDQLPNTRIWFGPLRTGFQHTSSDLYFDHIATRVFALSSPSGRAAEEVPANAASAAFVNWWNAHFDEIAVWEPQYQRLNQILKWSLLFGWLESHEAASKLEFLDRIPLIRSNWFPNWAAAQNGLRFTAWDKVGFHPPGYDRNNTETMEILSSDPYQSRGHVFTLSGGISWGSAEDLEKSKPTRESFLDLDRRAGLDYDAEGYPERIVTERGTGYRFLASKDDATVTIESIGRNNLRGSTTEFGDGNVTIEFRQTEDGLEMSTAVGRADRSSLTLKPQPNGFWEGRARELDFQTSSWLGALSENSGQLDPMDTLARQPGVTSAFRMPEGRFLVRSRGNRGWFQVEPDSGPFTKLEPGQIRVGEAGGNSHVYKGVWISDEEATRRLNSFKYFRLERTQGTPEALRGEVDNRGPPNAEAGVKATAAPSGSERQGMISRHLARSELPPDAFSDPQALDRLLPRSGFEGILQLVNAGDLQAAARELARDPLTFQQNFADYRAHARTLGLQAFEKADYPAAVRALSPLADLNSTDPDVLVRLGIARLSTGLWADALADLGATFGRLSSDTDGLLRSTEEMVKHLPAAEQHRLARLPTYVEASNLAGRQPELKLTGFPYEANGQVRLVLQFQAMAKSPTVAISEALAAGTPKYVHDAWLPGADWLPSSRTIDQLAPGHISYATRVNDPIISKFLPDGIVNAATGEHFSLVDSGGLGDQASPADKVYFLHLRIDK
jgi:hypothetical protein